MKKKLFLLSVALLACFFLGAQTYAVQFDGTDDHVQVATSLGVSNTYTVEGWFYPTNLTGPSDIDQYGRTLFSASSATGSYPLWLTLLNGNLLLRTWTTNTTDQTIAAGITTNKWYHIAVTSTKGGTTKLYINGLQVHSYTNANATTWPSTFTIGAIRPTRPTSILPFQGRIDEVRVWNTVRSQSDIQSTLYNQISSPPSSLVGYWKLDETSGTTAYDSAGTAQNGTLSLGAAFNANGFVHGAYYRSRATGNWTAPGTWEASVNGSSWTNAVFYPVVPALVYLPGGYTVTLNANSACLNMQLTGGTLAMGSYTLNVDGVFTETSGSITSSTPTVDGYQSTPNHLEIAENSAMITGFSASNSTNSTLPQKINRQWAITGAFTGNKTCTFYWDAADDQNFNWGVLVPSVYKGNTEYTQTGYDVVSDPRWVTVSIPSFDAKASFTVGAAADETLPVELTTFTASMFADYFVRLHWVAQSEVNHSGYNLYRAENGNLNGALKINSRLIDNGEQLGSQVNYTYTDFETFSNSQYYYWLESVSLDGMSQFFGPLLVTIGNPEQEPQAPENPLKTSLLNAFPNPFNPTTNLRYSIKTAGDVHIDVFNLKGQLIRSFSASHYSPGYYQVSWDGKDNNGTLVSSGIYMYRMTTGSFSATKRMILAK